MGNTIARLYRKMFTRKRTEADEMRDRERLIAIYNKEVTSARLDEERARNRFQAVKEEVKKKWNAITMRDKDKKIALLKVHEARKLLEVKEKRLQTAEKMLMNTQKALSAKSPEEKEREELKRRLGLDDADKIVERLEQEEERQANMQEVADQVDGAMNRMYENAFSGPEMDDEALMQELEEELEFDEQALNEVSIHQALAAAPTVPSSQYHSRESSVNRATMPSSSSAAHTPMMPKRSSPTLVMQVMDGDG